MKKPIKNNTSTFKIILQVSLLVVFIQINSFAQGLVINEVMSSNNSTLFDADGDTPDWIELYNSSSETIELSDYFLSDDYMNFPKWRFPTLQIEPGEFTVVFASGKDLKDLNNGELHTNFKVAGSGESIYITNSLNTTTDSVFIPASPVDISFGRNPDGSESWMYLSTASPEETNNNSTEYFYLPERVNFSKPAGKFSLSFDLSLSSNLETQNIYYTTNGAEPTSSSTKYVAPFEISSTKIVRTRIVDNDTLFGPISTQTFLFGEETELPIISVVTDPDNLWDYNSGIYANGPGWSSNYPHFGANYWQDWEKPAHLEMFEDNGELALSQDFGLKIFSGYSRVWPQKAFSFFARNTYGDNDFDYKIFPNRELDQYKSFIVRNSGSEWSITLIRDAMMQQLIKDNTDIDYQEYRPSLLFLNGEYWGIYNIREKLNEDYLAGHYKIDKDKIDIIEGTGTVVEGSRQHYNAMISFLRNNDIRNDGNYEYLKTQMDVNNFIDYQIAEIYIANTDWPGGNIKYWRPQTESGRWRWLMYDTDFGFGYFGNAQYFDNTLAAATATNGPGWPNPPASTYLLRRLLSNNSFKNDFISRFADHINITFSPDKVKSVISDMRAKIESEMSRHRDRWINSSADFDRQDSLNEDSWERAYDVLNEFATERPSHTRMHIQEKFDLSETSNITFNIEPQNSGIIKTNLLSIPSENWTGVYFNGVLTKLTAIPKPGYRFIGWTGDIISNENELSIIVDTELNLTAIFELSTDFGENIVINEINYSSDSLFYTDDWIELYNNSETTVDLSLWKIQDSDKNNSFIISTQTIIQPKSFLIITKNEGSFFSFFPDVKNSIGDLGFGLNSESEQIKLYNKLDILVDSVNYSSSDPWPNIPNGTGATLELIDPNSDNSLVENWRASIAKNGSPGKRNSTIVGVEDNIDGNLNNVFRLEQNYPNPFNHLTTINYSNPRSGIVNILVFNILGEKVASVINDFQENGYYSITFDASNLSSGIYFYSLRNGEYYQTKKMILLK